MDRYGNRKCNQAVLSFALLTACMTLWTAPVLANEKDKAADAPAAADTKTADDTPAKSDKPEDVTGASSQPAPPLGGRSRLSNFRFGLDYFYGVSNASGLWKSDNDANWAGYGPAFPSMASGTWSSGDNMLRLSMGIGAMSNSNPQFMERVTELFYRTKLRSGDSLQIGKFFVPFASQEWVYSSKYGMMLSGERRGLNYTAALHYSRTHRAPNLYLKVGKNIGKRTVLNISGGLGAGVMAETSHTALFGADLAHDFGGATFTTEYDLGLGPNGPFQFAYGRLTFTKFGAWQPYVGAYYWRDASGDAGSFRSALVGLSYRANALLTLDAGFARTQDRSVLFFQSRTNF